MSENETINCRTFRRVSKQKVKIIFLTSLDIFKIKLKLHHKHFIIHIYILLKGLVFFNPSQPISTLRLAITIQSGAVALFAQASIITLGLQTREDFE